MAKRKDMQGSLFESPDAIARVVPLPTPRLERALAARIREASSERELSVIVDEILEAIGRLSVAEVERLGLLVQSVSQRKGWQP